MIPDSWVSVMLFVASMLNFRIDFCEWWFSKRLNDNSGWVYLKKSHTPYVYIAIRNKDIKKDEQRVR